MAKEKNNEMSSAAKKKCKRVNAHWLFSLVFNLHLKQIFTTLYFYLCIFKIVKNIFTNLPPAQKTNEQKWGTTNGKGKSQEEIVQALKLFFKNIYINLLYFLSERVSMLIWMFFFLSLSFTCCCSLERYYVWIIWIDPSEFVRHFHFSSHFFSIVTWECE